MTILSDRRYPFAAAPDVVWATMADVAGYRRCWPWLDEFDGRLLAAGEVWTCAVRAPVPWVVRFRLAIGEVVEGRRVTARLEGDILGEARIDLAPTGAGPGSEVRLRAALAPDRRALRLAAALARPVVRFGHDWVLDTGARQFGTRLPSG